MTFVKVDKLPDAQNGHTKKADHHNYESELEAFMRQNIQVARVVYLQGEFRDEMSAYKAIRQAVRIRGLPIHVYLRSGDVYLVRKDI